MNLAAAFAAAVVTTANCLPAWGQFIISAKAGLVNHIEGRVLLAGAPILETPGAYRELHSASELSTEDGRAEVLLNPGLFLRIGEKSAVRMLSNNLASTRLEFIAGAAVIEPGGRWRDKTNWASPVTVAYRGVTVHLRKYGTYRFDAEPAQLRVYAGQASVKRGALSQLVSEGELISLVNPGPQDEFDVETTDSLGEWSMRRSALMSEANETAARQRKIDAISHAGVWPRALINSR